MKEVKHPNLISMKKVFAQNDKLYITIEYMTCDLGKLIDDQRYKMNEEDIKYIFKSIIDGVDFMHKNWIMHRVSFFFEFLIILGFKTWKYSY